MKNFKLFILIHLLFIMFIPISLIFLKLSADTNWTHQGYVVVGVMSAVISFMGQIVVLVNAVPEHKYADNILQHLILCHVYRKHETLVMLEDGWDKDEACIYCNRVWLSATKSKRKEAKFKEDKQKLKSSAKQAWLNKLTKEEVQGIFVNNL